MSFGDAEYYRRLYFMARRRADEAEAKLHRIAAAHAGNAVTKNCEQCGRPSPCLTLQILEEQ